MADEWDAGTYQRVSEPQLAWGRRVVERIAARRATSDAIDAGCGTGRVTRLAGRAAARAARCWRWTARPRMVEEAVAPARGPWRAGAPCARADLLELEVDEPADLIVSTATFHWILDHERLFARLHAALRPGGRLVAQCGGVGNIAAHPRGGPRRGLARALSPALSGMPQSWLFAGPEDTVARLEGAGFTTRAPGSRRRAALRDMDARSSSCDGRPARTWTGWPGPDPASPRGGAAPGRTAVEIDYVRLNMEARRRA